MKKINKLEKYFVQEKKQGKNIWSKIKYFREANEIFLKLCQ